MSMRTLGGLVWLTAAAVLGAPGVAAAATFIDSEASATAAVLDEFGSDIDSEAANEQTSASGQLARAAVYFCPEGITCEFPPTLPPDALGQAETRFGRNKAYANAQFFSTGSGRSDFAWARSHWSDDWALGGVAPSSGVVQITIDLDGEWQNSAIFSLVVAVVDPVLGTDILDSGLVRGTIGYGLVSNCVSGSATMDCGDVPGVFEGGLPGGPAFSTFINVNPNGDEDGDFSETLIVSAPFVANRNYQVSALLFASTGPGDQSLLDAFGTAQVTQVLIPQGATLNPSGGTLGDYNVTAVPEPGTTVLIGAGILLLATLRLRRS